MPLLRVESAPTMIIPRSTDIQVDAHGQLSIRTPGNLVIQNSGHYNVLESAQGSIRIESGAQVEAVTVRCADTCFVEGSLTAWKVTARAIHLEDQARAHIVLQETERLEVGRDARLVGNFGSEKELFLLFSRFAQQFRTLPFYFDRPAGEEPPRLAPGPPPYGAGMASREADALAAAPRAAAGEELPEPLFFAQVLLERETARGAYGPNSRRAAERLARLLKERDLETLRSMHRTLFSRILEPGADTRRAQRLVDEYYAESGA
jgi:hypothetical protein